MDFITEKNRIFVCEENQMIGEATFPEIGDHLVDINHVEVNPDYRGQGIANKLMLLCVEELTRHGFKAVVSCPYAIKFFKDNEIYRYILK